MTSFIKRTFLIGVLIATSALFSGCGEKAADGDQGLIPITLQTDWYAQAEHGGFYQALAEGYYEEFGLEVTINQGGPNAAGTQKVVSRQTEFSIGRADDIIVHASNNLPLAIVAALMQHDPQAFLVHEESGIKGFKDLDGRTVMTTPGSPMVRFIEKNYGIKINVVPIDYGMSRFLANKDFVQQCFITNEPFYIKQAGANPRTLLIADSGFDLYRVIFTNRNYAEQNPEIVKAFVAASIKGWKSYMTGPRDRANALISELHPKMTPEFLDYSISTMLENHLVGGNESVDQTGLIQPARMQEQIDMLLDVGLISARIDSATLAPTIYLPPEVQAMIN